MASSAQAGELGPGSRQALGGLQHAGSGPAEAEDPLSRYWDRSQLPPQLPRLTLPLASRPGAVAAVPWQPPPDESDRLLEPGVSIGAVYRQAQGQLPVLGGPGAGKTTLLHRLAQGQALEAARAPARPIPIILSLSSWAVERRHLADWLVSELEKHYQVAPLMAADLTAVPARRRRHLRRRVGRRRAARPHAGGPAASGAR